MLTIILIAFIAFLSLLTIQLNLKNRKMSNKIKKIDDDLRKLNNSLRNGYYTINASQKNIDTGFSVSIECIIFVSELDRYINGESKLKLVDINMFCNEPNFNSNSMRNYITNNFRTIRSTNEITWLESEFSIKEARKSKMEKIIESLKSQ